MTKQSDISTFFTPSRRRSYSSGEEDSDYTSPKRHRSEDHCPVCQRRRSRRYDYIQCSSCEKWIHLIKCSGLSPADTDNSSIIDKFECRMCSDESAMDATVMEAGSATSDRDVLMKILTELSSLRKEARVWRRIEARLRELSAENEFLRRQIGKKPNIVNPRSSSARGRPARRAGVNNNTPSVSRSRSRSKTLGNARFLQEKQPSHAKKSSKTVVNAFRNPPASSSTPMRNQPRTLRVTKSSGGPTSSGLPKSKLRLVDKRVMVVLRDSKVSCRELHNYLASKSVKIRSVTELTEKSKDYKTFVIECHEAGFEALFNEDLWHHDTFLKEYFGPPHQNRIHSVFPQRG